MKLISSQTCPPGLYARNAPGTVYNCRYIKVYSYTVLVYIYIYIYSYFIILKKELNFMNLTLLYIIQAYCFRSLLITIGN